MAACQEIPRLRAPQNDRHALQSKDAQPPLDGRAGHTLPRLGNVLRLHTRNNRCGRSAARVPAAARDSTPIGAWARLRYAVPRAAPGHRRPCTTGPQTRFGMRHSPMALVGVRNWPTAVSPRASSPRKVIGSGPAKHVEIPRDGYVVVPIIGGPHPLPGVTTRRTYTSITPTYRTLKREEALNVAPESCEKLRLTAHNWQEPLPS